MKKYLVTYSPQAKKDISSIYTYIAFKLNEKGIAANQIRRIKDAVKGLEYFPSKYESFESTFFKGGNIRKMPVDNYLAIFLVDEQFQAVTILRIVYGGTDLSQMNR